MVRQWRILWRILWLMRVVETPVFTRVMTGLIDDDAYRVLQLALLLRPTQGAVIRHSGGLRKLRWARPGAGKRGGLRITYYWAATEAVFYMLFVYSKSDKGDLTPAQIRRLGQLVQEEFQ